MPGYAEPEYAELHAHSAFSFLDGVSLPEKLVAEAVRLGLAGLALTDHDGFHGAARFAEAAEGTGLPTVFGSELTLRGERDEHLLVLARGQSGYHRLAGAITEAHLAGGAKHEPWYDLDELAERAGGEWVILTGCRRGTVRSCLPERGVPDATDVERAGWAIDELVRRFGHDNVVVELWHRGSPLDDVHNDVLAGLAVERGLSVVATGLVHYATAAEFPLFTAFAALGSRRSLDDHDGYLPAAPVSRLRSPTEMERQFARYPGAVAESVRLARACAFELKRASPNLPKFDLPEGQTLAGHLRELVWEAVPRLYSPVTEAVRERIERELTVIEELDFPGYFLIVHDIVQFARSRRILCQGRGSAANSAVCYALGITAVDSIAYGLPFERFLSALRDEPPDIDVDFDTDRREEVIQYVFEKYGRRNAAQVANVITYRPKNAIRDIARAFGHGTDEQNAWSRLVERWRSIEPADVVGVPPHVIRLTNEALTLPRHLGIHSGGMVLTDQPVGEVVPIEHARMPGRTVLQWDKDDCAYMGLVKFDLLGLGMLGAISQVFVEVEKRFGETWELGTVPREEPAVYDAMCRSDVIGVFQIESRAQMGLLPRLRPRRFYDIVVQIAMVRPGPIQGGSVHPFVRRRTGQEPIVYDHPKLIPVLERTMGVPIFQEQLMQMAMAVGGLDGADADVIRRSIGSKRGLERLATIREKLFAGMAANGIPTGSADKIYRTLEAFAHFGFAESHSIAFSLLVYVSAWLKVHYPAAFLIGLLRSQPMGFYSAATLSADAERHGVEIRVPCIARSGVDSGLEAMGVDAESTGRDSCLLHNSEPVPPFDPTALDETGAHRRDGNFAVRMGLADVRGIGRSLAEAIVTERDTRGDFRDLHDLVRRTGLERTHLEALATAGAFDVFGLSRREALWEAGHAAQSRAEYLEGAQATIQMPLFDDMDDLDAMVSDRWATGVSPNAHPVQFVRGALDERGVIPVEALRRHEPDRRIEVAGLVTHRQRPATAKGITFLNLEDETGVVNVLCSRGLWKAQRTIARESAALIVRGILQRSADGVTTLVADRFEPLGFVGAHRSRDFR